MERGARLSGSRFAYLRGDSCSSSSRLVQWTLRKLRGHGFEPVIPPVLVREEALFGTGFLPDTEQQIYHLPEDDLYLAGTSEVALASLPRRRAPRGGRAAALLRGLLAVLPPRGRGAGRDQRGIFRVHQFDKVEMFCFVRPRSRPPGTSGCLAIEEEILTELEIPYRVVNIGVDDLGASAGQEVRLRGVAARARASYRELHVDVEHHRLPGPAGSTSATARPAAAAP
jgi:seryl-tRNA synthetase